MNCAGNIQKTYGWVFLVFLFAFAGSLFAQQPKPPFWDEIQKFKKQDSIHFPAGHPILFVGSSSFTRWHDLPDRFPGVALINQGFGGSSLPDLIYYFNDVIVPYHPKQIVVYCGENDFAANDSVTVDTVVNRFKQFFERIRQGNRKVFITYISMKPSPSRIRLLAKFTEANESIKLFMSGKKRTSYVDVYTRMLNADGTIREELFLDDQLHMNAKGYDLWQAEIKSHLRK